MASCGECRFFEPAAPSTDKPSGACRRHAPGGAFSTWPAIYADQWCGEFAPKGDVDVSDPLAVAAADLVQFIKDRISICGHGTISATCAMCLAPWLPR